MAKKTTKPSDLIADEDLGVAVAEPLGDLPADEASAPLDVAAETAATGLPSESATESAEDAALEADETTAVDLPIAPNWKPASCINCGETTTEAIVIVKPGQYRCRRCKHEWTRTEEQAPFRRLARR